MDCVLFDINDDGEKEIIAVTYLSDLFIIKKEEVSLKSCSQGVKIIILEVNEDCGFKGGGCLFLQYLCRKAG